MTRKERRELILSQRPVLLHGTDARILAMSDEERMLHNAACRCVINYLWPQFEPQVTGTEINERNDSVSGSVIEEIYRIKKFRLLFDSEEDYRKFTLAISICYNSINRGSSLFEYDATYFTINESEARHYAERAGYFGEIGFVAYSLIDAFRLCKQNKMRGFRIKKSLEPQMKLITDFVQSQHRPVVVFVNDYNPDFLQTELGDRIEIRRGIVYGSNYRYLAPIDLSKFPTV